MYVLTNMYHITQFELIPWKHLHITAKRNNTLGEWDSYIQKNYGERSPQ